MCRCTGYRPIYQGFVKKFCGDDKKEEQKPETAAIAAGEELIDSEKEGVEVVRFLDVMNDQLPMHPVITSSFDSAPNPEFSADHSADEAAAVASSAEAEHMDLRSVLKLSGRTNGGPCTYWAPTSVDQVLEIMAYSKNYRLQVGATERRVEKMKTTNH